MGCAMTTCGVFDVNCSACDVNLWSLRRGVMILKGGFAILTCGVFDVNL